MRLAKVKLRKAFFRRLLTAGEEIAPAVVHRGLPDGAVLVGILTEDPIYITFLYTHNTFPEVRELRDGGLDSVREIKVEYGGIV